MAVFLIPSNGMAEVQVQDTSAFKQIQDPTMELRIADALQKRKIDAMTSLSDKGLLVLGSKEDARSIWKASLEENLFAANTASAPKTSLSRAFGNVVEFPRMPAPAMRRPSIMGGMALTA